MSSPVLTPQSAPGIYLQQVIPPPAPVLMTGVPAFLGYAQAGEVGRPRPMTLWPQFSAYFGAPPAGSYLAYAVRGFFENGGTLCYAVRLDDGAGPVDALRGGLAALAAVDAVDLLCAPDIMAALAAQPATGSAAATEPAGTAAAPDAGTVVALQQEVLADCQRTGGRFAILDAMLAADTQAVVQQRDSLADDNGALYHPWVRAPGQDGQPQWLPPCGHVAGIYSRSDQRAGVGKAPANEVVAGVSSLRASLADDETGYLYAQQVNCLRALRGRGIRVWGARTLSADPQWQAIGARRVMLTMGRWLERFMAELAYEPNDVRLWVRIMRELTAYLDGVFQSGALQGATADEAFFVKCDGETNPPEVTAAGLVVTLAGVALAAPAEFIRLRIISSPGGVAVQPASATA